MKERIQAWIDGARPYWEGVKLYEAVGESGFLKRLFARSEDDYNHAKLAETLEAWLTAQVEAEQTLEAQMPTELLDKKKLAKRLMDERSALKERLRVYYHESRPASELKEGAFRILEIGRQLDDIFSEERFWKQTGYLPEREVVSETRPPDLVKRRLTLRTYVTKYRKSGDAEKLKRYENELWEVEEKLKAHGIV